ncbi:hypothetical protein PISMIDRAFT_675314 [Pisolithus microcarpus 441]|uniref:Uncharacterized protein n=1 Tax=Pisolithus microcarpus 441 TaxID=765257 RepID=A0A0C9ZMB7_9AGAM|nr:hypothetical protein PISMIDRAFT_675314 [Pisolithus microcarpus 441]
MKHKLEMLDFIRFCLQQTRKPATGILKEEHGRRATSESWPFGSQSKHTKIRRSRGRSSRGV